MHQKLQYPIQIPAANIILSKKKSWASSHVKTLDRKVDQAIQIRNRNKEIRKAKPTEIGSQYTWTRWTTPERKLKWRDICWQMKTHSIQFRKRSVYDQLHHQPTYIQEGSYRKHGL